MQGTCHSLGRATGTCGTYGCTCSDRWELIYKRNETSEERFTCFCRKQVEAQYMRFSGAIFEQDGDDPVPLQQKEGVKPSHAQDPQGSI